MFFSDIHKHVCVKLAYLLKKINNKYFTTGGLIHQDLERLDLKFSVFCIILHAV